MFFFILRNQDILLKTMRNELAQTRAKLNLLEMRLANVLGEDEISHIAMQDLNMDLQRQDVHDEKLHLNLDPFEEKK